MQLPTCIHVLKPSVHATRLEKFMAVVQVCCILLLLFTVISPTGALRTAITAIINAVLKRGIPHYAIADHVIGAIFEFVISLCVGAVWYFWSTQEVADTVWQLEYDEMQRRQLERQDAAKVTMPVWHYAGEFGEDW
jgi:phosphatidylglycerophosphate synthase